MCFTVNVNIVKEELQSRYGSKLLDPEKYIPSYYYHAFSYPDLPTLYIDDYGETGLRTMKWGLVPWWVESGDQALNIRSKTHNARSETVMDKPSFRQAIKDNRCIVPVRGFFEWQHTAEGRRPWYIYGNDQPVLSLAAIFDAWHDPDTVTGNEADPFLSFSILTTAANRRMQEIHNTKKRMPVIIRAGQEYQWLTADENELDDFFNPLECGELNYHMVNPILGNKKHNLNRPEIIEPYTYPSQGLLF